MKWKHLLTPFTTFFSPISKEYFFRKSLLSANAYTPIKYFKDKFTSNQYLKISLPLVHFFFQIACHFDNFFVQRSNLSRPLVIGRVEHVANDAEDKVPNKKGVQDKVEMWCVSSLDRQGRNVVRLIIEEKCHNPRDLRKDTGTVCSSSSTDIFLISIWGYI